MSMLPDGGPAYPVSTENGMDSGSPGISTRDRFALEFGGILLAHAISRINPDHFAEMHETCGPLSTTTVGGPTQGELIASLSYAWADYFLLYRKREETT